jgi:hypothetical protein
LAGEKINWLKAAEVRVLGHNLRFAGQSQQEGRNDDNFFPISENRTSASLNFRDCCQRDEGKKRISRESLIG